MQHVLCKNWKILTLFGISLAYAGNRNGGFWKMDMDQIVKSDVIEKAIRSGIETEFQVALACDGDDIVFTVKEENNAYSTKYPLINQVHYAAAIRRNPPLPGPNHIPCMADIVRVNTNYIIVSGIDNITEQHEDVKRLLQGSLAYQNRMQIPFTLLNSEQDELFEPYGFHYVYDMPCYGLNKKIFTEEILQQAVDGKCVVLDRSNITLSVLDKSGLLTLAHFVNATLCKKYGLFIIRNALYFENLQTRTIQNGGTIYLIKEDGRLIGYFIYFGGEKEFISEAVFENDENVMHYLYEVKTRKPKVMARIVNLHEMLKHISSKGKVTIAIRLTDPIILENDGLFIWYLDEKGSYMERVQKTKSESGTSMRPEITTTIGGLTAFLFEYIKLKESLKFESIYKTGPAWITEIL